MFMLYKQLNAQDHVSWPQRLRLKANLNQCDMLKFARVRGLRNLTDICRNRFNVSAVIFMLNLHEQDKFLALNTSSCI